MNNDGIIAAIAEYNAKNVGGVQIINPFYAGSLAGFTFTTTINGVVQYNDFKFKVLSSPAK